MQDTLNHWNADNKGLWIKDSIALGNLALYNTPESINEQLPLHDSLAGLTISADLRLDNREELYPILRITNTEEKNITDAAIVLQLYKKYNTACINYLIGDFVFAIWDGGQNQLFCARDHMGVRPFFYYHHDGFFSFASEKKGILCLPNVNKTINKQFFYNQAIGPRVQAAQATFHQHIYRLSPAHTLVFEPKKNKISLNKYWTLDAQKETILGKKEDNYEGLKNYFEIAVKCRLRSAYPIGAELSGGIDSSAVTGVASSFLKKEGSNIITFTNTNNPNNPYPIPGKNERKLAEEVINYNEIGDYSFIMDDIWDNILDEIDFALVLNDGPELQSLLWELPIKKAAAEKQVKTLLSGFCGDQMVTYRGQFYFLNHLDKKDYYKYRMAKSDRPFNKLKPFLPKSIEFLFHKLKNFITIQDNEIKFVADFFKIPFSKRIKRGDVVWEDNNYLERYKSYRHYQKYRLLKPEVSLRMEAESRQGLHFRVEPRYPMADIRLTQYYLSLPNELKSEGRLSRSMFRTSMSDYIPQSVLNYDDKTGANAPFRSTQKTIQSRVELTCSLLQQMNANAELVNLIRAKSFKFKYLMATFPELLRWCEKNFDNY